MHLKEHEFPGVTVSRFKMLLSSMLLNSETWVDVTNDDIEMLEAVDRIMMRRILDVPISTSKPALYLELGCIPIRYIIKARRLLFLQYILKRNKNETISKVFWAQKYLIHISEMHI